MQYSFTEKKRIRKSFAKRPIVHQVPFLLATQLESFSTFLQAETIGTQRKAEGLQAALPDVLFRLARQGPPGAARQGIAEQAGRQGSEGAGSLHGRNAAHDADRFVRDQRYGTRDRVPVAPFAWRVL